MTSLCVKDLNKFYGKHQVLKNLSFTLEQGEIVGFIGPNGSGKSTTMKCIANLVFPNSGEITIAGHDLFKARRQALSHLSALIEAPGLYFNLSGLDNLLLFASLRGIPRKRVDEVVEFTGLGQSIKKRAGTYSMGMKQRLALGIAILTKPTFIILDEPFSGLDPNGIFELRNAIKALAAEGSGIIFSSHQILEMDKIAHRNIFIKDGSIIPQGQAKMATMLQYKLFMDREKHDFALLSRLKDSGLLADFNQEDQYVQITLPGVEKLSPVLANLLDAGREIRGIMPLTADIENLYNSIYENGASK